MMRWLSALIMMVTACAVTPSASAAEAKATVVPIPYGLTKIKLTDDVQGILALARRENGNTHGFSVLTIYAEGALAKSQKPFLLVSFIDDKKLTDKRERLELTASGGADCRLNDFRLIQTPGQPLQMIVAERRFVKSFYETEEVTFTTFTLRHVGDDGEPGWPDYYFESSSMTKAKQKYCDVNDAFKKELGLGPYQKDPDEK